MKTQDVLPLGHLGHMASSHEASAACWFLSPLSSTASQSQCGRCRVRWFSLRRHPTQPKTHPSLRPNRIHRNPASIVSSSSSSSSSQSSGLLSFVRWAWPLSSSHAADTVTPCWPSLVLTTGSSHQFRSPLAACGHSSLLSNHSHLRACVQHSVALV